MFAISHAMLVFRRSFTPVRVAALLVLGPAYGINATRRSATVYREPARMDANKTANDLFGDYNRALIRTSGVTEYSFGPRRDQRIYRGRPTRGKPACQDSDPRERHRHAGERHRIHSRDAE